MPANVARHASVHEARVDLIVKSGPAVRAAVSDAGRGFDVTSLEREPIPGFGLLSVRQRLESTGGGRSRSTARQAGAGPCT